MVDISATSQNSFPGEYVIGLALLKNHGIVAALSDQSVRILPRALSTVKQHLSKCHAKAITGLKTVDANCFVTCGTDGFKIWDARTSDAVKHFKCDSGAPLLCVDVQGNRLATGTELVNSDAGVVLWDLRSQSKVVEYIDSHNDDVTDIVLHPTEQSALLSGSVDGLVNLYNATITNEDEAVYQTINHGASIHRVGFLSEKRIFALSHMETFSIYQVADPNEEVEEPKPAEFGDIREPWKCQYVCDVLPGYVAVGSNSKSMLRLLPFQDEEVDLANPVNLVGGHGDEVARAVLIDSSAHSIYSGGEDGIVKIWKADMLISDNDSVETVETMETDDWQEAKDKQKEKYYKRRHKNKHKHTDKKDKSKSRTRYKPY